MLDGLNLSDDILIGREEIDALKREVVPGVTQPTLTRLHRHLTKARASLGQFIAELEALESEGETDRALLVRMADDALEKGRKAAEEFRSGIDPLSDQLAANGGGMSVKAARYLRESLRIANVWLAGVEAYRIALLRMDVAEVVTPGKVLRARPVEGAIDYAELSRDTIAKFPKILAALAK